ncbi:hypothetical protein OsI_30721 [Oryza sativa Indica Group]|uniref:Secreted protein n=1 Tax=Oryza sativa subsp. indica TaxID=39946 RepID=B8BE11_ORYSI|nr:hypothetical protein OsI_30721 [Oryza sativa Indica Group]
MAIPRSLLSLATLSSLSATLLPVIATTPETTLGLRTHCFPLLRRAFVPLTRGDSQCLSSKAIAKLRAAAAPTMSMRAGAVERTTETVATVPPVFLLTHTRGIPLHSSPRVALRFHDLEGCISPNVCVGITGCNRRARALGSIWFTFASISMNSFCSLQEQQPRGRSLTRGHRGIT